MMSGRWKVELSVERAELRCQRQAKKTLLYCPPISTSLSNINFKYGKKKLSYWSQNGEQG